MQNSQTDGLQIRKEVKTKLSATLFERLMQLLFTKATVPQYLREIGEYNQITQPPAIPHWQPSQIKMRYQLSIPLRVS